MIRVNAVIHTAVELELYDETLGENYTRLKRKILEQLAVMGYRDTEVISFHAEVVPDPEPEEFNFPDIEDIPF